VGRLGALAVAVLIVACGHAPPPAPVAVVSPAPAPPPRPPPKLVVLLAESDAFPHLAKATTESLLHAQVDGLQGSKVSLEVVQLSIECVESSVDCYQAVGRSLAANALLFAQIAVVKRKQLRVTVSLFDVDGKAVKTKAEKVFASEQAATAGIADLVAEATR
jgi:hypothetical protein